MTREVCSITQTNHGLNRLIGAVESPGSSYRYAYDLVGNRTDVWVDGTRVEHRTYDAANQVVGWTYDAAGNLLNDGTTSYTYDALNRLTRLTQGSTTTTYQYNGDGVLVAATQGGTTTHSAQDLAAPLSQVLQTSQDSSTTSYVYGHERLVALSGVTQTWYGHDALGSVRQTLDGSGTATSAFKYDPWGVPRDGATPPTFGFTGELQEPGGLVYLRARWYQPQQGRFTSRDPFAGFPTQPYSQHPYQYGYNSPIRYTDPSGKNPGVCLIPAVADGPIPAGDVVTVACAIVYGVGALVSAIAGQAAGEATGQIIRDQDLHGYYHTGTAAPVLSPRQVPPTTIMPPAPLDSGVRPFPGYADPQDVCVVPGLTPLPDFLRQRGRPGPTLLPGQGPTILAASLESIFKKYPSTSMKCDICANQAAKELSTAGYDVDIVRLTNSDPRAPYMLAKGGKLVGITGFHEVVRINMPHGPLYIDSLVYETYGAIPIDWETYKNLWEYPDDIVQSTSRKPK